MFIIRRVPIRIISVINSTTSPAFRLNSTDRLENYEVPFSASDNFAAIRKEDSKSLRIAILGAPNAGKSTLINRLVDHQICASSAKKHTTRVSYRAILHFESTELVFIDTPGVVSSGDIKKYHLEKSFEVAPVVSLKNADIVGILHDVSKVSTRDRIHKELIELLNGLNPNTPTILLLNKVDKMKNKRKLLEYVNKLSEKNGWPHFADFFMLSALSGDGVQDLRDYFLDSAKPREWDFPDDSLTDQKPEDIIVRMVRANMLNALPGEMPYCLNVKMEYFKLCEDGSISTYVLIECPSERLHKIILGKLKPQLRGVCEFMERQLTKIFQRMVRLQLVITSKEVVNK